MSFDTAYQNTGLSEGQGYALHQNKEGFSALFYFPYHFLYLVQLGFHQSLSFLRGSFVHSVQFDQIIKVAVQRTREPQLSLWVEPTIEYLAKSLAIYGTFR